MIEVGGVRMRIDKAHANYCIAVNQFGTHFMVYYSGAKLIRRTLLNRIRRYFNLRSLG